MNTVQLYKFINQITDQIPFVHSYSNKSVYEVWNNEEIKYGSVVFAVESANTASNYTKFNVILYYGDRLTSDRSNVEQVQSDALAVIQAIIGSIQRTDANIEVTYPVQNTLFEQKFADELAGAYARFTIISEGMGECGFTSDLPIVPGIVDINDYYTKKETDDLLFTKADKSNTYTKSQVDQAIDDAVTGGTIDLRNYYKKTETYNQTEIDDKIKNVKVDLSAYDTSAEVDEKLKSKVNTTDFDSFKTANTKVIDGKANVGDSYLKSETYDQATIDDKIKNVKVDLSDYDTSIEVDEKLKSKADKTDLDSYDTTIQVDTKLDKKLDKSSFESFKTINTEEINKKANVGDSYLKSETYDQATINKKINDAKPDLKPYAKTTDVDTKLGKKLDKTTFESFKTTNTRLINGKANVGDSYLKNETYDQATIDDKIKNVKVDLSEYAKTVDVNNGLNTKVDKTDFESFKTTNTEEINKKANTGDSYLKSETYDQNSIDTKLSIKADISYVDNGLANKVDNSTLNNYDTSTQVNTKLESKANVGDSYLKSETYDQATIDKKIEDAQPDLTPYAKTTDVDTKLEAKADTTYVDQQINNNKVTVDTEISETSTNPVQNNVITKYINTKLGEINTVLESILNDK